MSLNGHRIFTAAPTGIELELYERCAADLANLLLAAGDGPFHVVVESLAQEGSRQVIDRCLRNDALKNFPSIVLAPWRYAGEHSNVRISLAAHVIEECHPEEAIDASVRDRLFRMSKSNAPKELYRWLQESAWSPVMQVELDRVIEAWLKQRIGKKRFILVVEGIEECDAKDQEICRELLVSLLNAKQAIVLIDSHVSAHLIPKWPVQVAFEVPALSPGAFDDFVRELFLDAGLIARDHTPIEAREQHGLDTDPDWKNRRLAAWSRLVRDACYPETSRARRIVNDMAVACRQAQSELHVRREKAQLGALQDANAPRALICAMVLLSCRFGELADLLQTRVDGTDAFIRLVLWSQRNVSGTVEAGRRLASEMYRRVASPPWSRFLEQPELAKFLRDCFGGAEPLVNILQGRHFVSSYLWAVRRPRVKTGLNLSAAAMRSFVWWLTRRQSSWTPPGSAQSATTPDADDLWRQEDDVVRSDDWELMSLWALAAMDSLDASQRQGDRGRRARKVAELAPERAVRANDMPGELRARGALAVVLASYGDVAGARVELERAKTLTGRDGVDILRLDEFAALVLERTPGDGAGNWAEKSEAWRGVMRSARNVGLDVVADGAAAGLWRVSASSASSPEAAAPADGMLRVFISYRHADAAAAQSVKARLETIKNCVVFIDKDIQSGTLWMGRLRTEIDKAQVAVVLLSKAYVVDRRNAPEPADDFCYLEASFIQMRYEESQKSTGPVRSFIPIYANLDDVELPVTLRWTSAPRELQWAWPRTTNHGVQPHGSPDALADLAAAVHEAVVRLTAESHDASPAATP